MNDSLDSLVFAAQSAFLELLELIEGISTAEGPENEGAFQAEAQKTVLMFIAAIILASRDYRPAERSFLTLLVNCDDKPGGQVRYLNEYAVRWTEASQQIPQFFEAAVQYDKENGTNIARNMVCQLQLIGNNACASDEHVCAARYYLVQGYVAFLEAFADAPKPLVTLERNLPESPPSPLAVLSTHPDPTPTHKTELLTEHSSSTESGSIGYFGLNTWWLQSFTEEQRAYILSFYSEGDAKTINQGTIRPSTTGGHGFVEHSSGLGFHLGSCVDFLKRMAGPIQSKDDYAVGVIIVRKIIALLDNADADVIDKHHGYGWMAKRFYKERHYDEQALHRTIWACLKQIEVALSVTKLITIVNGMGVTADGTKRDVMTWHEGYMRLAILLEKEKDYGRVVTLCEQALEQGWVGADWRTKLLKCKVYCPSKATASTPYPRLPELKWDEDLIAHTQSPCRPPLSTTVCPIPPYELSLLNGVLQPMTSEQQKFYLQLVKAIGDKAYPPLYGQFGYLHYYINDKFKTFDQPTLQCLYDTLLLLADAYKTESMRFGMLTGWSYDCLIALESYDRFFEVTKPANIFSISTHFANFRCNVRFYVGKPASGVDFLQMYGPRITKITKQHPNEYAMFLDAVLGEEEKKNGSWFEQVLAGSDRKDYQNNFMFWQLQFVRRSKIPSYCFFRCSDMVHKRLADAFREAENRLRQYLGEKNVGEQWTDETFLFNTIKKAFPELEVIHHGRPEWLGQMHLDVWIPDLKIAIEYHGPQHFQAMEHYGGAEALEATKKRDRLKRAACERMGVQMFEVTSSDQVSQLIDQIKRLCHPGEVDR